jgi:hypothetical protein
MLGSARTDTLRGPHGVLVGMVPSVGHQCISCAAALGQAIDEAIVLRCGFKGKRKPGKAKSKLDLCSHFSRGNMEPKLNVADQVQGNLQEGADVPQERVENVCVYVG